MAIDDIPAPEAGATSRRSRREHRAIADETPAADAPVAATDEVAPAPAPTGPTPLLPSTAALSWVDADAVADAPPAGPPAATRPRGAAILPLPPRRRGWIGPVAAVGVLAVGYVAACALWPLSSVEPSVSALAVETPIGEEFPVVWPEDGTSALAAQGGPGGAISSDDESLPMASITKVVTALMIIENQGLAVGDDGATFAFTQADSDEYWAYLYADESAVDVPVDGTLTLYQMLQGVMLGSANNYVDRLVQEIWGTQEAWLADATAWLADNGLDGITVTDPSGIDPGNVASARALIALAERAEQDPVLAEIMAQDSVTLPGAGLVENSNPLIGDEGVIGLKTGSLWSTGTEYFNLLAAKDVTIGQTTVTLYSAVLGQPDEDSREIVSRTLLDQLEEGMQQVTAVDAGAAVARITTEWGAQSTVVTSADADVISWQGVAPATDADYEVAIGDDAGDEVGTLLVTGGMDSASVPLQLSEAVPAPSFLWRLAHPLALLGLD
ncbi:D-alanyl-D-alanine carboxypeptidase family protein [Microbacterium sp. NPDC055683]